MNIQCYRQILIVVKARFLGALTCGEILKVFCQSSPAFFFYPPLLLVRCHLCACL